MKKYDLNSKDTTTSNESYYIENERKSDRNLFDLDSVSEITFDEYMHIKAVNEAAKKELARRKVEETYTELMKDFEK